MINNLQPKVSILIPAYNSEKFIEETLQACITQTYSNFEIIVVDDGSTDRTLAIANKWALRHSNILVFSQPNSGACKARNLAFEKSTGDYIMYLDADDIISSNKLQAQIECNLRQSEICICPWIEFFDSIKTIPQHNSRLFYHNYSSPIDLLIDLWSTGEMIQPACYIAHRNLISKTGFWDESLCRNQDGEFFCRLIMNATAIKFTNTPMVYYRRGHASISTAAPNKGKKLESTYRSFVSYEKETHKHINNYSLREALSRNYAIIMAHAKFNSILYNKARKRIIDLGCVPQNPKPSAFANLFEKLSSYHSWLRFKSFLNGIKA